MKIKSCFLVLATLLSLFQPCKGYAKNNYSTSDGKDKIFLHLNHPIPSVGMFSVFCFIAGVLYEYDNNHYAGIKADFSRCGLYYDPACGENWWSYYCEPIPSKPQEAGVVIKSFDINEYCYYAFFAELHLSRHVINDLIKKYIHVKPHILAKVDTFAEENFDKSYNLGIHYRGTDKRGEAPRMPYQRVAELARDHLREHNIVQYKIFVASDEQPFVDYMKEIFGDKIIYTEMDRAVNDQPIHYIHTSSDYLKGEQAFVDCLLLSKVDILFRTSSNLSLWSAYFNPDMPVVEMTDRNYILR